MKLSTRSRFLCQKKLQNLSESKKSSIPTLQTIVKMTFNQDKVVGKLEMKKTSPKMTSGEELIIEIENGLKHTDQATLITLLAALKNGFDARNPSPFEWLPDEMIMKIIRMTINDFGDQRHNHLVGNIAKISRRFENLAADKSLWKGRVYISGWLSKFFLKEVIHKFLGSEVEEVEVEFRQEMLVSLPNDAISAEDISVLLEKCHNIKRFKLIDWRGSTSIYPRHGMMKLLLRCPGFGLVPVNGTVPKLPIVKEGRPVQWGLREEVICARHEKIWEKKMKNTGRPFTSAQTSR